jgi:hypothetical protein
MVGRWCAVHSLLRFHVTLVLGIACGYMNEWTDNYEKYSTAVLNGELGGKM